MAIYRVQGPDGAIHKFEGPDDATPDQVTAAAEAQFGARTPSAQPAQQQPAKQTPGNWQVTNQAINKGIAGGIDTLLNAPVNLLNLGKSLGGVAVHEAGLPSKYMPTLTETPDFARKAMTKVGMINEASEPQTALQRILDTGGQALGGSVVNPAAGMRQAAANIGGSGLAGLLGGAVREGTGSDVAGMATSMLAPMGMSAASNAARTRVAQSPKPNVVLDQTLEAARKEGLVVPPTTVNPSNTNRIFESIGGKAATQQAVSIKNQPVIDNIARREAGLSPNDPLTPETLAAVRTRIAKPYEEVRAIGDLELDAQYKNSPLAPKAVAKVLGDSSLSVGGRGAKTISSADAIDAIKKLRADAKGYYAANSRNPHPETLEQAKAAQSAADDLEGLVERNLERLKGGPQLQKLTDIKNQLSYAEKNMAALRGTPVFDKIKDMQSAVESAISKAKSTGSNDLLDRFRKARVDLAKNYQVEGALREGGGTIDPKKIAQATQKGLPLTGGLKTVGDFANNFPKAAIPLSQIGSPGVSKLEVGQAGAGGVLGTMLGGPVGGAVGVVGTMTIPPAMRKIIMSPKYQAYMAKTGTSPSMVAQALSKLPPNTNADTALQMLTTGRTMAPGRLTDLLGEQ